MEMEEEILEVDGSICRIHVRNFFCHDNLEINLNKNVNFIVGRNGSGKSAILTALVVGLGGRAAATNRGSNLHSFIKKGANSATIEIKIKNNSRKAYKHNVYGDYITIVRHINSSGGSTYKVKSASGELISTKYEEVNAITLAHDIQVDNPISVLNQDDARSFHASDAKKKYLLFRKATNMDQTETNYKRALENCNKAESICSKKINACVELEKEYKKWKISYEQLQSRDEIEAKKQELQNEYYWSEIAELEKEVNLIQTQYNNQNARIERLVEKLTKMTDNYGSNNNLIDTLKSQLELKKLKRTTLEQELHQLEGEVRSVQVEMKKVQNATAKQNELLNREKRKVVDLESEIQNIDSDKLSSRRAGMEARARAAAESAEAARARYSTAQHEAQQAQAHAARAASDAERAAARAHRQRDSLKQLKQQLRELESRGNDSLAVYGNNMAELCQRVKQAASRGQFTAPPRGPVGSYIKVKDKKWAGALEHIIGGSVQSFCVNSPEDSRKLFEIMGQVYGSGRKPSVTCSKFLSRVHDVRKNKVSAGHYVSALDAVDVTDPVVANFLIDNVALERVLLVPEHEDAVKLSDNVENVPENCAKIVTVDCSEYHPAPNYRSYGGASRPARFLHLSTDERKSQVQAEIQEAELVLRSLEEQAEEMNNESKQAAETERQASMTLKALLTERYKREEAARAAAATLDQHQAPHLAVLVEELKISQDKIVELNKELEIFCKKEAQFRAKVDEYDIALKKVKSKLGQVTASCRTLSEEIGLEQIKMDQGVSDLQTCEQKIKEDKTKIVLVKKTLEDKQQVLEQKIGMALTLCPRVENPREKSLVTSELKKTQQKLSSIRSDGLTKAQVAEKLLDVERKYRRTKLTLDRLKELIDEIKHTTDKHLNFCHRVQISIARRVQYCFQSILQLRGYSGRMDIDNARGVLDIFCTGRETSDKRHASSTLSLSGGERSYSTVAFIMALWECVELPFCFMDEFDVFMDNVNRKIVMELLIDHALENKSRQFVFLTPQDTSSVTSGPNISIHMMADPRP